MKKSVRILSLYSQTLSTASSSTALDNLTSPAVEKERKRAEKQKKFDEKKAKTNSAAATTAPSKTKEKKSKQGAEKEAPLPEYVEETPQGQKKSTLQLLSARLAILTAVCRTEAPR